MINEKKLYSISQAAELIGVSADTLRRWEEEGLYKPVRTTGGQRRYEVSTLKKLRPLTRRFRGRKNLPTKDEVQLLTPRPIYLNRKYLTFSLALAAWILAFGIAFAQTSVGKRFFSETGSLVKSLFNSEEAMRRIAKEEIGWEQNKRLGKILGDESPLATSYQLQATSYSPNLLKNPSFETKGTVESLAFWQLHPNSTNGNTQMSNHTAHSGSYSLLLSDKDCNGEVSQTSPSLRNCSLGVIQESTKTEAGRSYALGTWLKMVKDGKDGNNPNNLNHSAFLHLALGPGYDKSFGIDSGSEAGMTGSDGWEYYSATFTNPPPGLVPRIYVSANTGGFVFLDDVSMVETESIANNGDNSYNGYKDHNTSGAYLASSSLLSTFSSLLSPGGNVMSISAQGIIYPTDSTQTQGGLGIESSRIGKVWGSNIDISQSLSVNEKVDISGKLTANGNVTLGNNDGDEIEVGGRFISDLLPKQSNAVSIGTSTQRWNNLFTATGNISNNLTVGGSTTITGLLTVNGGLSASGGSGLSVTGDLALDGDLDFQGPQNITTTSDNLTISPTGNLVIDTSGGLTEIRDNLGVVGTTNLGDGGVTNYLSVSSTGDLTFNGSANNLIANNDLVIRSGQSLTLDTSVSNNNLLVRTGSGTFDVSVGAYSLTTSSYSQTTNGSTTLTIAGNINRTVSGNITDRITGANNYVLRVGDAASDSNANGNDIFLAAVDQIVLKSASFSQTTSGNTETIVSAGDYSVLVQGNNDLYLRGGGAGRDNITDGGDLQLAAQDSFILDAGDLTITSSEDSAAALAIRSTRGGISLSTSSASGNGNLTLLSAGTLTLDTSSKNSNLRIQTGTGSLTASTGSFNLSAGSGTVNLASSGNMSLNSSGELAFDDQWTTSPISFSQSGQTGLNGNFVNSSILGAINELASGGVGIWIDSNGATAGGTVTVNDTTSSLNVDLTGTIALNSAGAFTIGSSSAITGALLLKTTSGGITLSTSSPTQGELRLQSAGTLILDTSKNSTPIFLQGGLVRVGSGGTVNNASGSGALYVQGALEVDGSVYLGDISTDDIVLTGQVGSNLIPNVGSTYNLGSTTNRWLEGFIDTLTVTTLNSSANNIAGITGATFTIDTSNTSGDTQDISITFERGTPATNSQFLWDASEKFFSLNAAFNISPDTDITTLSGENAILNVNDSYGGRRIATFSEQGIPRAVIDSSGNILLFQGSNIETSAGTLTMRGYSGLTLTTSSATTGEIRVLSRGTLQLDTSANNDNILLRAGTGNINLSATQARLTGNLIVTGTETFNGVTYTFPGADGSASNVLTTSGTGLLSWGTLGAASITADSLDFSELKDSMNLDADTSINGPYSLIVRAGNAARQNATGGSNDLQLAAEDYLLLDAARFRLATSSGSAGDLQLISTGTLVLDTSTNNTNLLLQGGTGGLIGNYGTISLTAITDQIAALALSSSRGGITLSSSMASSNGNIYLKSAGTLQLDTSAKNANILLMPGTGNVGIGTTGPLYTLDVSGGTRVIGNAGVILRAGTSSINLSSGTTSTTADLQLAATDRIDLFAGSLSLQTSSQTAGELKLMSKGSLILDTSGAAGGGAPIILQGGNVGIGTTSPGEKLRVVHSSGQQFAYGGGTAAVERYTNTTASDDFTVRKARGTFASPLAVQQGDGLGGYYFNGYNGSAWQDGAFIEGWVDAPMSTYPPTAIVFGTSDGITHPSNLPERMRINSSGNVGIGTTGPSGLLHVTGDSGILLRAGLAAISPSSGTGTSSDLQLAAADRIDLFAGSLSLQTSSTSAGELKLMSKGSLILDTSGAAGGGAPIRLQAGTGNVQVSSTQLYLTGNLVVTGTETFNGVTYTFPGADGNVSNVLTTSGTGLLSWGTLGAASITADSLDFTEFKDEMTLDADTTINGNRSLVIRTGLGSIQNSTSGSNDLQLSAEDKLILGAASFDLLTSSGAVDIISGSYLDLSSKGTLTLDTSQNNANILLLSGSGNVGIGTTVPNFKLDLNGGIIGSNAGIILRAGQSALDLSSSATSTTADLQLAAADRIDLFASSLKLSTSSLTAGELVLQSKGSMTFDTSGGSGKFAFVGGNVGIGTTRPEYRLEVGGSGATARINNVTIGSSGSSTIGGTAGGSINLQNLVSEAFTFTSINNTTNSNIFLFNAKPSSTSENLFQLQKSGTAQFTIDNSGNLGIGTTGPLYTLDVSGGTRVIGDAGIILRAGTSSINLSSGTTSTTADIQLAAADRIDLFAGSLSLQTSSQTAGELKLMSKGSLILDTSGAAGGGAPILLQAGSGNINLSSGTTTISGNVNLNSGILTLNGISYTFPGADTANGVLISNGNGLLSWNTIGASNVTADSLDFTEFKDSMNLDADTSINGPYSFIVRAGQGSIENSTSGNNDLQLSAADKLILGASSFDLLTSSGGIDMISGSYMDLSSKGTLTLDTSSNNSNILLKTGSGNINVSTGTLTMTGVLDVRDSTGTLGLVVDSTGNVGIGTTGPGAALETSISGASGDIAIFSINAGSDRLKISADTNDSNILTASGNNLKLGTSGSGVQMTLLNSGNVGIGTTGPLYTLDVSGGTRVIGDAGIILRAGTSSINLSSGTTSTTADIQLAAADRIDLFAGRFSLTTSSATAGDVKIDSAGTLALSTSSNNTNIRLMPGTGTLELSSRTTTGSGTTSGANFMFDSLTTGIGLSLSNNSASITSGSLFNMYWNPDTTATATGNLFNLNVGALALVSGNIFNIQDNGSNLFSVNQTSITNALPTSFTAAGDVSIAYDIQFTNPTASYIKSIAPLYLVAGETFNSSDLTLQTYNYGDIILDAGQSAILQTARGMITLSTGAGAGNANLILKSGGTLTLDTTSSDTNIDILAGNDTSTSLQLRSDRGGITLSTSAASGAGDLRLRSAGTLQLDTSAQNTNILLLPGTGNIGIGTTVPNFKLDLNGGIIGSNAGIILRAGQSALDLSSSATSTTADLQLAAADRIDLFASSLKLSTSSTTAGELVLQSKGSMTFDTSGGTGKFAFVGGNVGIGTTGPGEPLDVQSNLAAGNTMFGIGTDSNSTTLKVLSAGTAAATYNANGTAVLNIGAAASGDQAYSINTQGGAIFARTLGNVGIGTTSPGGILDVIGNSSLVLRAGQSSLQLSGGATSTTADIQLAAADRIDLFAGSLSLQTSSQTAGELKLMSKGSLILDTSGAASGGAPIALQAGSGNINLSSTGTITLTGNTSLNNGTLRLNGLTYTFPGADTTNGVLLSNGSGVLSWTTLGGSSITNDSLDFAQFDDSLDLDADTSINGPYSFIVRAGLGSIQNSTSGSNDLQLSAEDKLILAGSSFDLSTSNGAVDISSGSYLDLSSKGTLTLDTSQNNSNIVLRAGSGAINLSSGTTTISGNVNLNSGTLALNGIAYTFPGSDGSDGQALTTNAAGTLRWANPTIAADSLDFTEFKDEMTLDADTSINGDYSLIVRAGLGAVQNSTSGNNDIQLAAEDRLDLFATSYSLTTSGNSIDMLSGGRIDLSAKGNLTLDTSQNNTNILLKAGTGNINTSAGALLLSGNLDIHTSTGNSFLYANAATGNVGIGTTSPTQKLSVAGIVESTSGGFKFPDGTIQTTADTIVRLGSFQTFTSGTSATYTTPASTSYIVVEVWGGGGGGGGYNAANSVGGGGGGGSGYSLKTIALPNATYTYTVGAGGSGSTGNGTAGNTSSFDTVSATGGALGCGGGACGSGGDGGNGGDGSGGDINITGQNGGYGDYSRGYGGSAPRGGGGGNPGGPGGGGVTHNGSIGRNFGGGGGGGGSGGTSGGNGGSGGIVVYEYKTVTSGTDLAENYPVADPSIGAGDIVSFDSANPIGVKRATAGDGLALAGIISTQPGIVLSDKQGADAVGERPVALSGRVPVKIDPDSEPIEVGDFLTSSDKPGLATKAIKAGYTVGKALENWTPVEGCDPLYQGSHPSYCKSTIEVFVNLGYYIGPLTADGYIDTQQKFIASDVKVDIKKSIYQRLMAELNLPSEPQKVSPFMATEVSPCGAGSCFAGQTSIPADTVSASVAEVLSALAGKLDKADQRISTLESQQMIVPPATELTLTGSNDELRMTNDELVAAFNIQHSTFNILSPATIGGNLTVGLLTIDDLNASINSMGETLKLQNLGLADIEFMGGKVTIDTAGNLKVEGEITAEKVNIDTSQPATASAGQAVIALGETEIEITTAALTTKSLIFVTPEGEPVAVATEKSGAGKFFIKISTPLAADLKVNWWIIN